MGRALLILLAAVGALLATGPSPARASDAVAVYETSNDGHAKLARQPDQHFAPGSPAGATTVDVDPAPRYQTVTGFGAAFTDSSLSLLAKLPRAQRATVLHRLLDPHTGIGLSVMRVPMGASDFTASGLYSYDDLPPGGADPGLAHFSIAHDQAYVLPVLREALHVNPHLKLIASPWSPPAWMKTNDSMLGVTPTDGVGRLRPEAYGPFADYFVRFLRAYHHAGVPIWAVTPQNEPLQPTADYPGMQLTAAEEAAFVHNNLAPALHRAGLHVRIYGYDYTWLGSEPYAAELVGSPAGRDVHGIAYHCYFGAPESMSALHALFPAQDVIEDECSTGISLLSPIQVVLRSLGNWATTILMWNVALDPSGGPKIGSGCLSCIGVTTIDPASGRVSYTGDYYQLGQASAFVPPGSRRVAATASGGSNPPACGGAPVCGLEYAALRTPGGHVVVIASNSSTSPVTFAIRRPDGQSFAYSLPGQVAPNGTDNSRDASVVTFVWHG